MTVETCLQDMASSNSLEQKLTALKWASREIQLFFGNNLLSLLVAAEEVCHPLASDDSRQALLKLISAVVVRTGLEAAVRERLFAMIVSEDMAADTELHIKLLRQLTSDGSFIRPIEARLCSFMSMTMQIQYVTTAKARSRLAKSSTRRSNERSHEEGLRSVLSFTSEIIRNNASTLSEPQFCMLLEEIFGIALKTTSAYDLDAIMATIAIATKSARLQRRHLDTCVEIMCGVAGMKAPEECPDIAISFRNLLSGPDRAVVAYKILDVLIQAPLERQTTVTRGAALTLKHCVRDTTIMVHWPIQSLVEACTRMTRMNTKHQLLGIETLQACTIHPEVSSSLISTDWTFLYESRDVYTTPKAAFTRWRALDYDLSDSSPLWKFMSGPSDCKVIEGDDFRTPLKAIACWFAKAWDSLTKQQQDIGLHFLFAGAAYVDSTLYILTIEIMQNNQLLDPAEADGIAHLAILVTTALLDPSISEEPRLRVLELLRETNNSLPKTGKLKDRSDLLVECVFSSFQQEQNRSLLVKLADLASEYIFDEGTLSKAAIGFLVNLARTKLASEQINDIIEPSEISKRTLAQAFKASFSRSPRSTPVLLTSLVTIASDGSLHARSRLAAMAVIIRVRYEANGAVEALESPDALDLTAVLMRPERQTQSYPAIENAIASPVSPIARQGRSSGINGSESTPTRSRSTTRSGNNRDRSFKPVKPAWMGSGFFNVDSQPTKAFGQAGLTKEPSMHDAAVKVDLSGWLDLILSVIKRGTDWEIYSFVLAHFPSQLSNKALFVHHTKFIQELHSEIVSQLGTNQFTEPPGSSGLKKGDVALCLYHTLTVLMSYHHVLTRAKLDESIRVFHAGMAKWDRATRCCIHALGLLFHELPECLERHLPSIVFKMSQIITQSHLAIDILEFLGGLSRCPKAYENVTRSNQEFVRTIFGMCISFIHYSREQGQIENTLNARVSFPTHRRSGISADQKPASDQASLADAQSELPDYVFTLAYHVITAWFLNMEIRERPQHVGWIAKGLAWKDDEGNEILAEQSQVTLDMMHRTAYLDLGETQANNQFHEQHGRIMKKSWLVGMSIVTIETAADSGLTQVTKRQASGTTHSMYQPYIAPLPAHHTPRHSAQLGTGQDESSLMYPDHVLLQLLSTIAPMPIPLQPIVLPDDETVTRALRTFDMNDTVDGYKAGVIYVGPHQTHEVDILANTAGSVAFEDFLHGLGTPVPLRGATFNAQGLDQHSDRDGTHTYAWRDRVVEIVFHVPTMMPTNLDEDPQCVHKKKHIGNNFVNIVYNDSGGAFDFDTLDSQFNCVNIMITPKFVSPSRESTPVVSTSARDDGASGHADPYFTVHTTCSSVFPQISPAATPKLISAENLASFVRQLALTASVFSQIWSNREGGEHISSWRNRLKDIVRLRERYSNTATSGNVAYPDMGTVHDRGGAKSYFEGSRWDGTLAMGGLAEQGQFLMSLDFTRWT